MLKHKFIGIVILLSAFALFAAGRATAQNFDSSGNSKLNGDFFVRQVITTNLDSFDSSIGRAISISGVMTFDGKGGFTFDGQKNDTKAGNAAVTFSGSGSYKVESNGMAQIQNLIDASVNEFGAVTGVGPVSIVASATESPFNDVFVAIQLGSVANNASLNGSYELGFIDFLEHDASQVRDGYGTLVANGKGNFGNVTLHGAMANQSSANVQQGFAGVTYLIGSPNGGGSVTFPTAATPASALISGKKTLYVSADGSLLLGGDPNGFDLIVGIKAVSVSATNSMFQGTYYAAALENDASGGGNFIDSFYGSTLALGTQGAIILHQRLSYFDQSAFDYTTDRRFNFAADGSFNSGSFQYLLGSNGLAVLVVGRGSTYSLSLNLAAQPSQATSVFIDPLSIFNAASYGPITNSVAPGEFISLYGSGLAASAKSAGTLPLPKSLGGTQVTVNGTPAPLLFVSPTQINLLVPFATTGNFATFEVINNNAHSNQVTVYTNKTAPGIFTFTSLDGTYPAGIGPAAVLHLDYSLVTAEHPAAGGETLVLYLTGLGLVTSNVDDGAAGPSDPPATVKEADSITVDIFDGEIQSVADVSFAGLAPGFAGVYQINFTVPKGVAPGTAYLDIGTNEAYTSEAKLFIK
jgi:uncharacterized protein (TIGR03437 family)